MRRLIFLIVLSSLTVPAFSDSKHPFTFEDMMSLKRISDPKVSPDGKWVIFSVLDVNLNSNTRTPHIWIAPAKGGQEREIISSQDAARARWAPDGKRFAYISNKEHGSQVWIADFDTAIGNVTGMHALTSIATEADGELWSPDGKNILFVSSVYPECADDACNARRLVEDEKSMVQASIFTRLLFRHVNAYTEGKRSHIFVTRAEASTTGALDLTPGDFDSPVFSFGQDNYDFSPDGQEICYTSNHDKDEAASTNNDLWLVPTGGGPSKNITADNLGSDSTPAYSPDGNYIAYRAQQQPGYESDRFRLMLYDRTTGHRKELAKDFDRWVGTFIWAPDSTELYFVSENTGESPIYSVSAEPKPNGNAKFLATRISGYNDDLSISPDGSQIVFLRMSLGAPNEIYAAQIRTTERSCIQAVGNDANNCGAVKEHALTHINDSILAQVAMSPLEPFWFTGAHGDQVEGFLVKPPNFDTSQKYPVKVFLKGGPQIALGDQWSYGGNLELFAASGYIVITINFHGSTGYGQKFIDAVNGDWGGAPFEDEMKGLDYAEKTYPFIDKGRECAIGSSWGGYMANWVLGHTDRFKCIVSHHSIFDAESFWGSTDELWFPDWEFKGAPYENRAMYEKWSPHQYAKNFKTPTLVIQGQRDYRTDVSQGFELFTTLQMEGIPSKMLYFPDESQYPQKPQNAQLWYKTVSDWVDQWTKK